MTAQLDVLTYLALKAFPEYLALVMELQIKAEQGDLSLIDYVTTEDFENRVNALLEDHGSLIKNYGLAMGMGLNDVRHDTRGLRVYVSRFLLLVRKNTMAVAPFLRWVDKNLRLAYNAPPEEMDTQPLNNVRWN